MKVTCPKCSAMYKVADEKIPAGGAKIHCPKCGNLFVVSAPAPQAPAPQVPLPPAEPRPLSSPSPSPEASTSAKATADRSAGLPVHNQSTPLEDFMGGGSPSPEASATGPVSPSAKRPGMSAIRSQSTEMPVDQTKIYKAKTAKGLTYNFPNQEALHAWLDDREDLSTCQVAESGQAWLPASQVQAARGQPAVQLGGASSGLVGDLGSDGATPLGDAGQPLRAEEFAKPASPGTGAGGQGASAEMVPHRAGLFVWSGMLLCFFLMMLLGAYTVTRYGLLELRPYLPLDVLGLPLPEVSSVETDKPQADDVEIKIDGPSRKAVFGKAMAKGQRALRSKRFSRAAMEFKRALSVHAGHVDALNGLATAFDGLGDKNRALATRQKARAIKSQ